MYDINNEKSFQSLENWLEGCYDACFNLDINNFPVVSWKSYLGVLMLQNADYW
jgi:hypothetical protein